MNRAATHVALITALLLAAFATGMVPGKPGDGRYAYVNAIGLGGPYDIKYTTYMECFVACDADCFRKKCSSIKDSAARSQCKNSCIEHARTCRKTCERFPGHGTGR